MSGSVSFAVGSFFKFKHTLHFFHIVQTGTLFQPGPTNSDAQVHESLQENMFIKLKTFSSSNWRPNKVCKCWSWLQPPSASVLSYIQSLPTVLGNHRGSTEQGYRSPVFCFSLDWAIPLGDQCHFEQCHIIRLTQPPCISGRCQTGRFTVLRFVKNVKKEGRCHPPAEVFGGRNGTQIPRTRNNFGA